MSLMIDGRAAPADMRDFRLHNLTLRVVCDDDELATTVAARLAHLPPSGGGDPDAVIRYHLDGRRHERPADARIVYESAGATALYSPSETALYAFHESGATMRCVPGTMRAEVFGAAGPEHEWVLTRPLLTLALMELARAGGLFPLHAACLAREGRGVLICGPSGSGKSTLTLALVAMGLDFLGDDLVFLRQSDGALTAHGFPDEVGLMPDVHQVLPDLAPTLDVTPQPGWPKGRVDIAALSPATAVTPSCAPSLVLLLGAGDDPQRLEAVGADRALLELLPSVLLTSDDLCVPHLAALATLASSATIRATAARPHVGAITTLVHQALPRRTDQEEELPH